MATPLEQLIPLYIPKNAPSIVVSLAGTDAEIRLCQQLRYRIFAEEMGANLKADIAGLDQDDFDAEYQHLMVTDMQSRAVIGTTRFRVAENPIAGGTFYSQTEFELDSILRLKGCFMEIGRTCIHADHRNGATIATLWQGIARLCVMNEVDYLIGCASIPLDHGPASAHAVMKRIRNGYLTPETLRVRPNIPLPEAANIEDIRALTPALLKAYLRLGAKIAGEPYWDKDFNVADVFIFLDWEQLDRRYARHFLTAE